MWCGRSPSRTNSITGLWAGNQFMCDGSKSAFPISLDLGQLWKVNLIDEKLQNPRPEDQFYLGSYSYIRKQFSLCTFNGSPEDCEHVWVCLILAFSWMGRGKLTNFNEPYAAYKNACGALKKAMNEEKIVSCEEFKKIVAFCNGSVIGSTKFLHFLNPKCYAIWDSRVYEAIFGKFPYHSQVRKPSLAYEYFSWLAQLELPDDIKPTITKHLKMPLEMAGLRARELILFMSGKNKQKLPIDNEYRVPAGG